MRREHDTFREVKAHFAGMPQAIILAGLIVALAYLLM